MKLEKPIKWNIINY